MPDQEVIIIDDLPGYRRVALVRDGKLDQIFIDDDAYLMPRPGAVLAVRVQQLFPDHDRVTVDVMGQKASFRTGRMQALKSGQMIAVMVRADARLEAANYAQLPSNSPQSTLMPSTPMPSKPMQVKEVGDISPKNLPAQPQLITPAPTAIERAQALCPDAELIYDRDGAAWGKAAIDAQLAAALSPSMMLEGGGAIHLATPPGAAVVDGDSGDALLAPQVLAAAMVAPVMRQLRLRRIGGPIVIDFPRLTPDGQQEIHRAMKLAAKDDAVKLSLHGWTRGGLYTLARPWQLRPLAEELAPSPRLDGLAGLRLIRDHGQHHATKAVTAGVQLRVAPAVHDWLNGEGNEMLKAVCADLVFSPKLVSDATIKGVRLDNPA